jgi:fructan beta-fructosidase
MCFSGGAAVDAKNTAGFKTGDEDVIVAFLTDTGAGESLAYSNDRGRTFTWYENNPVVEHRGRDPKVIWYAYDKETQPLNDSASRLGGHWVMAVYDEGAGGRNIAFYTSTDLKNWTEQNHLMGFFECPEIFKLPVDGDAKDTRWVVSAADARYVIGSFDGKTFTPEHEGKHQVHYGNYYASQTFDNAPDSRRIQIGWVKIDMPGMPFNQTFSFPHELTLRTTADGIRMFAEPVKEIEKLYNKKHSIQNKLLTEDQPVSITTADQLFDIHATFDIDSAEQIGLQIGDERIIYDVKSQKLNEAVMEPINRQVTIRVLVDRPMMEIIGNQGRVYITKPRNPGEVSAIQAFALGGNATLIKLDVYELNSIWR